MASATYGVTLYIREGKTASDNYIRVYNTNNYHQLPSVFLQQSLYHKINLPPTRPTFFPLDHHTFKMSSANSQSGQGQSGQGSSTPASTQPQTESQTETSAGSSGSLQRTGTGVMQQQLGQYYLYASSTQSSTSRSGQAGHGSPAGSQGSQSGASSRGR
jgi:hypothetical protein